MVPHAPLVGRETGSVAGSDEEGVELGQTRAEPAPFAPDEIRPDSTSVGGAWLDGDPNWRSESSAIKPSASTVGQPGSEMDSARRATVPKLDQPQQPTRYLAVDHFEIRRGVVVISQWVEVSTNSIQV